MCVVSMVIDHYQPMIDKWITAPLPTVRPIVEWTGDVEKALADFKKAHEAAKQVDALTGQPDCEDPEKAKLLEKVARLEQELELMKLRDENRRLRTGLERLYRCDWNNTGHQDFQFHVYAKHILDGGEP